MKRLLAMLLGILMMTTCAGCAEEESRMELLAINVGKGDALLLTNGSDRYLIDTGLAEHWGELSRALKVLDVTHLTGVILTHTDKDHTGGAWPLATSSIRVDGWYASAYYEGVKEKKHPAVKAAKLRGQTVTWLQAGDVLPLGDGELRVIGPVSPSETENCNSLVMIAEGGGGRILLAGDMEFPEEEELLASGLIPPCDVFKVGNHGEDDATSAALIDAVRPRAAIISTRTAEEPDTPSPRVMQLLQSSGADVYQTQMADAAVRVTIEAGAVDVRMMAYAEFPAQARNVSLTDREPEEDHIRIRNYGTAPVDVSGWYITSDRGGEMFVLPAGTVVNPGEVCVISTLSSAMTGDVVWPEEKVWHKSKDDTARLYDAYGRLISTME